MIKYRILELRHDRVSLSMRALENDCFRTFYSQNHSKDLLSLRFKEKRMISNSFIVIVF